MYCRWRVVRVVFFNRSHIVPILLLLYCVPLKNVRDIIGARSCTLVFYYSTILILLWFYLNMLKYVFEFYAVLMTWFNGNVVKNRRLTHIRRRRRDNWKLHVFFRYSSFRRYHIILYYLHLYNMYARNTAVLSETVIYYLCYIYIVCRSRT